jgi:hypothetical protein
MKYLHLGGGADGLWLVTDGRPYNTIAQTVKLPICPARPTRTPIAKSHPMTLKMDHYKIEQLRTKHNKYEVYILEGMDADDMIRMLLRGYVGKKGG